MGWYDWFKGIMQYLGLWRMEGKILFVGLDNAGKTTLLCLLSQDIIRSYPPTMHPQMDTVHIGKATFKAFDLGGHRNARSFWKHYVEVDAVVFMVDAMDRDRFEEAKEELNGVLSSDVFLHVPILVLGNKIDNPRAVDEHTLRFVLFRSVPLSFTPCLIVPVHFSPVLTNLFYQLFMREERSLAF
ncbi:GTP-binding protein SAR1b, variant 2 [Balamuthia mandrillaris]